MRPGQIRNLFHRWIPDFEQATCNIRVWMNCAANPQLVALEPFTIGTRPLDHGRKKLIEAGSSRELELGWHGYDTAIANQAAPLAPSWTCTVWVNLSHVDLAP